MTKQGIICPNCGAEITATSTLETVCPYCGGIVKNDLFEQQQNDAQKPKRIIPFRLNEGEAKSKLFEVLAKTDYVPLDIFDVLAIRSVHKIYMPMYRLNGTYSAPWSCTAVYRRQRTVGNKTEYYEEYQPASGVAMGGFNILCSGNMGDPMPRELREYTSLMEYRQQYGTKAVAYNSNSLMGDENRDAHVYFANIDSQSVWDSSKVYKHIDGLARGAACLQAPFNNRNFSMTWESKLVNSELLLFPFWLIKYVYKGKEFYYLIDGVGVQHDCTVPLDKIEKAKIGKINKTLWFVVLGCLSFLGIGMYALLGDFYYDEFPNAQMGGMLLTLVSALSLIMLCVRLNKTKKNIKGMARQERETSRRKYCENLSVPMRKRKIKIGNKGNTISVFVVFVAMLLLGIYTFMPISQTNDIITNREIPQMTTTDKQINQEPIVEVDSACCDSTVAVKDMSEKVSTSTNTSSINSVSNVEITSAFAIRIKRYNELGTFSEGLALVRRNGKWGYIDIEGNEVIPCKFDGEEYGGRGHDFSDGLAVIVKNGKHGYIDKKGEIVINADYDEAGDFSEGIACVQENFNDELTFIDKRGNSIDVLSGRFVWDWNLDRKLPKFRNGICKVHVNRPKDERYESDAVDVIWINSKGEQVSPPQIKDVDEDLVRYWIDDDGMSKVGYKDREGNIIVPARYSSIGEFSQGVAVAILRYGTRANSGMVSDEYIAYFGYVDMEGNDTFSNEEFQKIYNAYRNNTK